MAIKKTKQSEIIREKSLAGTSHFLDLNFGVHTLLKTPTVQTLTDSVSFTARFIDNLPLKMHDVLILHYKCGNGLMQCFQIIDSFATWKKLGKRKIQVIKLYSICDAVASSLSSTFSLADKGLRFFRKIDCPRCERKVKKKETIVQFCPHCETRFSFGTK